MQPYSECNLTHNGECNLAPSAASHRAQPYTSRGVQPHTSGGAQPYASCGVQPYTECNLTPSATLHIMRSATLHVVWSATLRVMWSATSHRVQPYSCNLAPSASLNRPQPCASFGVLPYTEYNLTPCPTLHIMWSATLHIMRSATLQMVLPVPGTATHPGTATRPGRAPRRKGFRNWFRKGLPKPEHGFNPASHRHTKALRVEPLALAGCGGQTTWGNKRQGGNPSSSVQVDILRYSGIAPDPPGYSGSLREHMYLRIPSMTVALGPDRSPTAGACPFALVGATVPSDSEVWRRRATSQS